MKAEGEPLSLKRQGLQADSLDCPEGGRHAVSEGALTVAKTRGGGSVTCLKCGRAIAINER